MKTFLLIFLVKRVINFVFNIHFIKHLDMEIHKYLSTFFSFDQLKRKSAGNSNRGAVSVCPWGWRINRGRGTYVFAV